MMFKFANKSKNIRNKEMQQCEKKPQQNKYEIITIWITLFEIAGQIFLERMSQASCIKKICIPAILKYISNSHKITTTQYPSNAQA